MKRLILALMLLSFPEPSLAGNSSLSSEQADATAAEVAFICGLRSRYYVADFEATILKDFPAAGDRSIGIDPTYRNAYDIAAAGCYRAGIEAKLPVLDKKHRQILGGASPPPGEPYITLPQLSRPMPTPSLRAAIGLAQSIIFPAFLAHRCSLRSDEWAVRVQFETIGKQRELEMSAPEIAASARASGIPVSDDVDRADGLAVGQADIAPRSEWCRLVTPVLLHWLDHLAKVTPSRTGLPPIPR